jgi:TPR repeat protein
VLTIGLASLKDRKGTEVKFRSMLIAPIILLLAVGAAVAGPLEDAWAAYRRNDYVTALRLYQPLADQGDADAQSNLGFMYWNGYGVSKNYAEAVKWYRKAADQGNADAQFGLGVMYHNGYGVPQDFAEAVKWYRKAADQGNADAQYGLGVMYWNGYGVPKNDAEAVKWGRKAADQGNAHAQSNLGFMYWNGYGVSKNYAEAVKWYRKAADQGDESSIRYLATLNGTAPAQRSPSVFTSEQWAVVEPYVDAILFFFFGLPVLGMVLLTAAKFLPNGKWRTRLAITGSIFCSPLGLMEHSGKENLFRTSVYNLFVVWFRRWVGKAIVWVDANGTVAHTVIAKTWWDNGDIIGSFPFAAGWVNISELIRRSGQIQLQNGGWYFTSEQWAVVEPKLRAAYEEQQRANFSKEVIAAFDTLGLKTSATLSDITGARNRLLKAHHPDHGGSTAKAQRINAAYHLLRSIMLNQAA